jgi:hypothetical protein
LSSREKTEFAVYADRINYGLTRTHVNVTRAIRITTAVCLFSLQPLQILQIQAQAQAAKKLALVLSHGSSGGFAQSWDSGFNVQPDAFKRSQFDTSKSIKAQATDLKTDVDAARNSGATDIVLVGHGVGGVRNRAYIQALQNSGQRSVDDNVKALVTIGTPNKGAPALSGLPTLGAIGITSVALAWTLAGGALSGASGAITGAIMGGFMALPFASGFSNLSSKIAIGAAASELASDSQLLGQLNNESRCRWETRNEIRYGWFGYTWWESVSYQICSSGTELGFKAIDNDIFTLSVFSDNNDVDNLASLPEAGMNLFTNNNRQVIALIFSLLSAGLFTLAFVTFGATVPSAIACGLAATYFWAFPEFYKTAIGSSEHDGAIPVSSQKMRSTDTNPNGRIAGTGWGLGGHELQPEGYYLRRDVANGNRDSVHFAQTSHTDSRNAVEFVNQRVMSR